MSFDERLKTAFKEETKEWNAPTELKEKYLTKSDTFKKEDE